MLLLALQELCWVRRSGHVRSTGWLAGLACLRTSQTTRLPASKQANRQDASFTVQSRRAGTLLRSSAVTHRLQPTLTLHHGITGVTIRAFILARPISIWESKSVVCFFSAYGNTARKQREGRGRGSNDPTAALRVSRSRAGDETLAQ